MAISKINYDTALFLDIETSKITCDNGEVIQAVYLTNVLEVDTVNRKIINSTFFRTMKDTVDFLNSFDEKLICFSHNLDYELTFLLRDIQGNGKHLDKLDIYEMPTVESVFRDKNAPLSIWLEEIPNINFRDTYALFNKSVAMLGKEVNLPKLEYQYDKVRTPHSELEQLDFDYNERDNIIVALSLFKRWEERQETLQTMPLTFTATTKVDRYKFIKDHFGKKELKALNIDGMNVYSDYGFYKMTVDAYQGGLTTANKDYFDRPIKGKVVSIDITSSYPYQMTTRRFPLFDKKYVNDFEGDEADEFYGEILHGLDFEELPRNTPVKGYFAVVEIINLNIKHKDYLLPLSSGSTSFIEGETVINGKVLKADRIIMTVDNVTLSWINKCYTYDDIIVSRLVTTTKDRYLRAGECSFILNQFMTKQTKKGVTGQEINYALAKVNVNNMYGVKVQKPLRDRYEIIDGNIIKMEYQDSYHFEISTEDIYNNYIDLKETNKYRTMEGKNFDIFIDGVYVTAYARYMLLDMMITLTDNGCTCIYTDTDSLKFITPNVKIIQTLIQEVNNSIINSNNSAYRFVEFKTMFNLTKEEYIATCNIGTWDIENNIKDNNIIPYEYFKTMGAKKYAYITDHIHTTIAGCSKKVNETIQRYCNLNNLDMITGTEHIFATGTMFDTSCSGRTVAFRDDRPIEETITFTYQGKPLYSNGGMIIEETSYTLNLSENDENVLGIIRENDINRIINIKGELYDKVL